MDYDTLRKEREYTGYKFKKGDRVICVEETSGQGGLITVGEIGVVEDAYYTMICPACVEFKRGDGSFAHVYSGAFNLIK